MKKYLFIVSTIILIMVLSGCGTAKVADDSIKIANDAIEVMEMYDDEKMDANEAYDRLTDLHDQCEALEHEDSEQDSNNTSIVISINTAKTKVLQGDTCIDEIKELKEVINK